MNSLTPLDTSAPSVTFACPDPWYTTEPHRLKSRGRCLQLTIDKDMHCNHLLNHRHGISRAEMAYYTRSLELLKKTHIVLTNLNNLLWASSGFAASIEGMHLHHHTPWPKGCTASGGWISEVMPALHRIIAKLLIKMVLLSAPARSAISVQKLT